MVNSLDAFHGPNAGYVQELYERYQNNPEDVDSATRRFFEQLGPLPAELQPANGNGPRAGASAVQAEATLSRESVHLVVMAARLARSIREYGHLVAGIDPLGGDRPGDPMLDCKTHGISNDDLKTLPATIVWPAAGSEFGDCLSAIQRLQQIYEGPIGYEFDHVQDFDERAWLHHIVESGTFRQPLSNERKKALLKRLTEVESFERFLHTVFPGQKRFSVEGNDMLIPMLDEIVDFAAGNGTRDILLGMAHRGRLNVLAHVLGKPYAAIFSEFHTAVRDETDASDLAMNEGWTGDVKYHRGARRKLHENHVVDLQLTLADNPSHLEFVDPVVEGFARAAQDNRGAAGAPRHELDAALAITMHGDAAFPGEGVVSETLNLSRLPGYETGGSIRIIVNNQIGFTTTAGEGRSTLYASDLAKGFEIPIVHVNADDPEACLAAIRLAEAYRYRFHKDFLVDLVGYRRWGHNEGDEPSFTQPALYAKIAEHPTVRTLYARELEAQGVISADEADRMTEEVQGRLQAARSETDEYAVETHALEDREGPAREIDTSVPEDRLRRIHTALLTRPEDFTPHPKLDRLMDRRREALDRDGGVDFALAEILAFGSILADGTPIRLTGQDTARGTFSQRHLVLFDPESGEAHSPLQVLPDARASFAVHNSPLTETATMGFEYGYSVNAPDALVLWEAQFGDFANVAQAIIDQFIVSARAKWRQLPALALLLPHGYEGQGPEHSSARLERYLQLSAENNLRVVDCSTAAQYFHVLRLQAATLHGERRPLVVMTPKSLLRHPRSASSLRDLSEGSFHPVLDDARDRDVSGVERLILCTGKVGVDVAVSAEKQGGWPDWLAVARVEQLYPCPETELREILDRFDNLVEVVWLQEEPRNMGAWTYMAPRLQSLLAGSVPLRYIGRPERASTAEGSAAAHAAEQKRLIEEALGGERAARLETRGYQNVG